MPMDNVKANASKVKATKGANGPGDLRSAPRKHGQKAKLPAKRHI
jgi:hypothetical protein|tara:strand:- start:4348 stop:4482 length:135 start_codon:yes stop_codon:yes gene_type:complete